MSTANKKHTTYQKKIRLNARANVKEMQTILTKAHLYEGGNLSKYLVRAAVGYTAPLEGKKNDDKIPKRR